MGIYLMPYGVKMEKVKAAFQSKDKAMLEEIKQTSVFNAYHSQSGHRKVSTEQALHQMIMGESYDRTCPDVYGYALIVLVAYLGENLTPEGDVFKLGSVNDDIERALKTAGVSIRFEETFFSEFYSFGLPRNTDFPIIGGISKASLKYYQQQLALANFSEEEQQSDFGKEGAMIFKRAVNYCVAHDLDWITFAH